MTTTSRTVAVTGAAGYLGPHVVRSVLERGHEAIAVVRPGTAVHLDPRATVLELDILSDVGAAQTILDLADSVIHLAWKDGFVHNSPAHMLQISDHYRFLTELGANGLERLVALGTMHEIGYWEGPISSDTPSAPLSQYGIAKDALRKSLTLSLPEQCHFSWARAYYIYGDDKRSNSVFRKIIEAAEAGRTVFPFTSGTNKYDFIRVEILADQLAALADASDVTGVINCATGKPIALVDQIRSFIADHGLNMTLDIGAFPDRPYDSPGVWADADEIAEIMARQ